MKWVYDASFDVRFWEKIDVRGDEECWPWTGAKLTHGYGKIRARRRGGDWRMVSTHRAMFELTHGNTLPPGKCVLHHCDNPSCCNPAHLFAGTQADNVRDMDRKGRRNTSSKLTNEDVTEIRRMCSTGRHLQKDIAALFGVSRTHVTYINSNHRRGGM